MTATWVALIAHSRIISNQQYIPCSLYQTCLVRDNGRMKIEPVKVKIKCLNDKKAQDGETPYLRCTRIVQPPANTPKCLYRDVKRQWRRSWMKIGSVNIEIECVSAKIVQEGEKTYLGRAHTMQPPGYHLKSRQEVHRPWRRCGCIKIVPTNVS